MSKIRYAVLGRWHPVPPDEAARILDLAESRYRGRLLSSPIRKLRDDTRTLEQLTARINEQTAEMRAEHEQREREPEDAALADLRETFGT